MASQKVAPGNMQFAFTFYKQVAAAAPSKNIFFSPVSISTALAMLSVGARSGTLSQMVESLGFPPSVVPLTEVHAGFHHLLQVLNDPGSQLKLHMGNALFIREGVDLLRPFLDELKQNYLSEAFSTDFQNEEKAKKQINGYVEEQTKGKIVDLLSSLDTRTVLVLISYIYFRGQWDKPFEVESTQEGLFHVDEHTTVKVPMMFNWSKYDTTYDRELFATVVQLPYKGSASALFILPDEGKLDQVEKVLSSSTVTKWKNAMHHGPINLYMPKFSLACTLDLKDLLQKMGITEVFSDAADLSGITGGRNLKASKAVHKAVLSIDEKGTEAAAATALEAMPMCLPPTIKFDRPFLLVIYHNTTDCNLFIGKIVNPTAQ
ncbi:hypothetical protein NDU88_004485 [Pleurodeles waltl]|uniref:Serpin domain-containing protein n=1 Tax=Pleurodeles waltl TaxID=8319 RepID=A0AAV7RJR0_PLEWA|nr:hypothetical protein NDU88_004485 [Pleurodeles waltl]